MEITIKCPHCGNELEAATELIGASVECPNCDKTFVVKRPVQPQVFQPPISSKKAPFVPDTKPPQQQTKDNDGLKPLSSIESALLGVCFSVFGVIAAYVMCGKKSARQASKGMWAILIILIDLFIINNQTLV